jgi:ferredoxin-type protein NapH
MKWICTPVLSCHSCVLSWFACPIGVFVHYAGWHAFPYLAAGMVLLSGVLAGRLFCGWMCPFGLLQDLLHKIPSPKIALPHWTIWGKYAVLAAMVVALPYLLGVDTWYSFCRICPASAIQVTIPAIVKEGWPAHSLATTVRLSVLVAVIALAVVSSRSFCKAVCPIGAVLAPLNYITFWTIKVPAANCLACGKCEKACLMDGNPSARIAAGGPPSRDPECVMCYECRETCPVHGTQSGDKPAEQNRQQA